MLYRTCVTGSGLYWSACTEGEPVRYRAIVTYTTCESEFWHYSFKSLLYKHSVFYGADQASDDTNTYP